MARRQIIKKTPKTIRTTKSEQYIINKKYLGDEPVFTKKLSQVDLINALNWYGYMCNTDDAREYIMDYLKTTGNPNDAKRIKSIPDLHVSLTLAWICRLLQRNCILPTDHSGFIKQRIRELLNLNPVREEDDDTPKVSVQDRMREKLGETIGEIEGWYDDYRAGKEVPDMVKWMRDQNVPQQFVNQIAEQFTPRIQELEESIALRKKKNRTDWEDQLVEGYEHITKEKHKVIAEFYNKLTTALETYGAVKKAVRKARVKKAPSKEKMVSKVKYCVENKELNLVSINPVEILGATQLWLYNVKTRKMGKYVAAADAGQLGIKGSTIIGYDEKLSVAKTLRKPQEQLKQFANSGKVALRTWLEDIKAVPVNLNGRLSTDWVLLKAIK